MAVEAGAVQCIEAAAAVAAQWAEPAEAAVVAAGAAAHGLDLSGSARTRVVRTAFIKTGYSEQALPCSVRLQPDCPRPPVSSK